MSDLAAAFRLDLLLKLGLAVILGGAIGLEREIKGKPAGLRTNILICVGSALLTDVSMRIGLVDGGPRIGDPARLAAQIVSGIGFIGAGTIMQGGGMVTGPKLSRGPGISRPSSTKVAWGSSTFAPLM